MISVRHITAYGWLDEHWKYVADERRVLAAVRLGGLVVALGVAVCASERPELGAYPIVRLDTESWRILPARFVRSWGSLTCVATPIAAQLGAGEQLTLTNAPAETSAALERLFA